MGRTWHFTLWCHVVRNSFHCLHNPRWFIYITNRVSVHLPLVNEALQRGLSLHCWPDKHLILKLILRQLLRLSNGIHCTFIYCSIRWQNWNHFLDSTLLFSPLIYVYYKFFLDSTSEEDWNEILHNVDPSVQILINWG